ncbi:hypothetical protein [Ralstonia phage RP31]|uniref:Uncharacterized protein n=2 Tax=Ripduovirus RP12 TaxID=2560700 RepID=A0A1L7N0R2_9CAUD|nr:hypothetical protein FDH28_gp085 [Ralstonia phage RP12]BAW19059.1 hypothetical protein [Ralstonia phage RP12]BAW19344.1 hypothetical protein [Ralstonia phage RP31]
MFGLSEFATRWLLRGLLALACVGAVYANFKIIDAKNKRIDEQIATIQQKDDQIKDKDGQIKQLKKDAVDKVKSDGVTESVKTVTKAAEAKPVEAKTKAQQYVEGKLGAINKKYDALPHTTANDQRKATEISLERAKGLWLTYCLQEPQVTACAK